MSEKEKWLFRVSCEEIFTTKDTKSTKEGKFNRNRTPRFQICGSHRASCTLTWAGINEVLIQISETFVSFVIFVVTEINVTVPG